MLIDILFGNVSYIRQMALFAPYAYGASWLL